LASIELLTALPARGAPAADDRQRHEPYRASLRDRGPLPMTFREQVLACLPGLRAYARAMGGSNAAADDLMQSMILHALAAEGRFAAGTNMRAWLITIMRNLHTSEVRKRIARRLQSWDSMPEHTFCLPATQITAIEVRELRAALKQVPLAQREALVLISVLGFSYEESASICGCEIGTIKSRVHRAKARLIRVLRP
jgi:RNA polymerase sigma-70 factor (ECF subfamily)